MRDLIYRATCVERWKKKVYTGLKSLPSSAQNMRLLEDISCDPYLLFCLLQIWDTAIIVFVWPENGTWRKCFYFKCLKNQSHVLITETYYLVVWPNIHVPIYLSRFMSAQQGSWHESVRVSSSTQLHMWLVLLILMRSIALSLWYCVDWGMSCRYTDYLSLGSCLIVWLLAFLALLDMFLATFLHS